MMRAGRWVAAALVAALLAGCGYTLGGNLPPHVKTVAVPIFKNLTQEPGIETVITAAIVTSFGNSGRLRVVPVTQADSIIEGEVVAYTVESIGYDTSQNAQQFRLWVTLNVKFRDLKTNSMLWEQQNLRERSDFRATGQVAQGASTLSLEEGATRQAALEIGRQVVSMALDRF